MTTKSATTDPNPISTPLSSIRPITESHPSQGTSGFAQGLSAPSVVGDRVLTPRRLFPLPRAVRNCTWRRVFRRRESTDSLGFCGRRPLLRQEGNQPQSQETNKTAGMNIRQGMVWPRSVSLFLLCLNFLYLRNTNQYVRMYCLLNDRRS